LLLRANQPILDVSRRAAAITGGEASLTVTGVSDQDYLVLIDSRIISVHGWNHPPGFAVGEIAFVPDKDGDRVFLGRRYRKAYTENGSGMPEANRRTIRARTGLFYDTAQLFSTKSIVDMDDVAVHIDASAASSIAEHRAAATQMHDVLSETEIITEGGTGRIHIGLTGSLRLGAASRSGNTRAHDVDIVFTGDLVDIADMTRRISSGVAAHPELRLYEHGKGWRIRARTRAGILCPFFGYDDPRSSPIYGLRMVRTVRERVTVRGIVVDDTHNAYLPTHLTIRPIEASCILPPAVCQGLSVIISHLRARGDFFRGDRGMFTGDLIELTFDSHEQLALSVLDGNESVLLTPPWLPF
jgi:hypothetical protein